MTPEQKERIRVAVRELSAALTSAGDEFSVKLDCIEVTTVEYGTKKYAYSLGIDATSREVIA